jgi:hypothetical protein
LPCVDYPKTELVLARQSITELSFYKTNTCLFLIPQQAAANFKIKKLKKSIKLIQIQSKVVELLFHSLQFNFLITLKFFHDSIYFYGIIFAIITGEHWNVPTD